MVFLGLRMEDKLTLVQEQLQFSLLLFWVFSRKYTQLKSVDNRNPRMETHKKSCFLGSTKDRKRANNYLNKQYSEKQKNNIKIHACTN